MSPAKTAESNEMPFVGLTRVGSKNYVLDGVQIPKGKGQWGLWTLKHIESIPAVYAKASVWRLTRVGPRKHVRWELRLDKPIRRCEG